jgi:NADH:ubiquinone oxidoreductase subunit 2 (subunit N)
LGILFSLALDLLAWTQPIGETLVLGTFRLTLEETMVVLGRRFVFTAADTPVLSLIYMGLAFWFGGAIAARLGSLFIPVGLTIAALLSAAIAVEPFLFAALLLEMVTILSIPLISPPGRPAVRGALRFLTFQTLAMPLILFTGWILEGIEASPADSLLVVHGNTLLAMGFALLLGIFPFHTWIPMLAEEVHPYTSAFIFYILSVGITFFGIGFLERYAWLRSSQGLYAMLQLVGTLMVLVAGLWAAFQVHLGRMLGFAFLMETGLALLTVSQGSGDQGLLGSLEILIASLLPRGLAFGLWALALTSLSAGDQGHQSTGLSFAIVQGRGRKYPIAVGAFIMAVFSLVGFPLLAGFPVRMALWNALAQKSWLSVMAALIGSIGLLIGGLRALAVLLSGEEGIRWKISEEWGKRAMLIVGALVLLLAGIFPQWFLPPLVRLTQVFLSGLP